jgi:hypothetical protein
MITITTINTIKYLIAAIVVYFPIFTFTGFFAAWVAKKLGDDTAEREGLLTLNPVTHTSLFGIGVLLFTVISYFPDIFGFGRSALINEHNIKAPFRKVKYLIALLARPLANILLMCSSVLIWISFESLIVRPYSLDHAYPALISSVRLLYLMFRQLNMITSLLGLISGLVRFVMSFMFPNIREENLFVILGIELCLFFILLNLIAPYLGGMIIFIEILLGSFVGSLIG